MNRIIVIITVAIITTGCDFNEDFSDYLNQPRETDTEVMHRNAEQTRINKVSEICARNDDPALTEYCADYF